MDILHRRCAGLDVHKKSVTAAVILEDEKGAIRREVRTFGTMTEDLLGLGDWLTVCEVTHVAMESTGDYWKPVFNILEHNFEVVLCNTRHLKVVPGRKTDVKDAEWLADCLRHGLVRPSFIPPLPQRDLRDLTRFRTTFVRERATLVNRLHKLLEGMNIKLTSVATDVTGVSARAILAELMAGKASPEEMAELCRGRLREKREAMARALNGIVRGHHRFILAELLSQIDGLDDTVSHFDEQIKEYCAPFDEVAALWDGIPGVARRGAEVMVSEMGTDMSRFADAAHLTSWAGVAPGNNVSANKRLSGRTTKGNKALRDVLNQAAHAAAKTKDTYLSAQYHRLAPRIGKKKAIVALERTILISAYHMANKKEPYRELGGNYFDQLKPQATADRLVKRLEKLGFRVTVQQAQPKAA
jgi:transposase